MLDILSLALLARGPVCAEYLESLVLSAQCECELGKLKVRTGTLVGGECAELPASPAWPGQYQVKLG